MDYTTAESFTQLSLRVSIVGQFIKRFQQIKALEKNTDALSHHAADILSEDLARDCPGIFGVHKEHDILALGHLQTLTEQKCREAICDALQCHPVSALEEGLDTLVAKLTWDTVRARIQHRRCCATP